jgi:hypothetical protein
MNPLNSMNSMNLMNPMILSLPNRKSFVRSVYMATRQCWTTTSSSWPA